MKFEKECNGKKYEVEFSKLGSKSYDEYVIDDLTINGEKVCGHLVKDKKYSRNPGKITGVEIGAYWLKKIFGIKNGYAVLKIDESVDDIIKEFEDSEEKRLDDADASIKDDTIVSVSNDWDSMRAYVGFEARIINADNDFFKECRKLDRELLYIIDKDLYDYIVDDDWEGHVKISVPYSKYREIVNKLHELYEEKKSEIDKKKKDHDEWVEKQFAIAKETGEKQLLATWNEECNDDQIECNLDIMKEFAMPNGKTKIERIHTY